MKILIIGANGAIGKIITDGLAEEHEVVTVGRTSGDWQFDIASAASIENMFRTIKDIDACICAAGDSETGDLQSLTEEHLNVGIKNKLLAQANLVLIGQRYLKNGGSFTLTSGKMGDKAIKGAAGKAFVNGAVNSFVLAASLDLERGLRLNAVSPAKLGTVPNEVVIEAYRQAVEGNKNGEIFRIY